MTPFNTLSTDDLKQHLSKLQKEYQKYVSMNLNLNMARGKPAASQLDLSNELLGPLSDYMLGNGQDARNYGILDGIEECRKLFAELLGLDAGQIIIGGNSSLNLMFDTMAFLCLFGTANNHPWHYYKYQNTPVKFLCPAPGYDRHFAICEELGIEMIPIPLLEDGPDMDLIEKLVQNDPLIKGIWCVPLHSNPQGVCYRDSVVERLAAMPTAAADFRIFWDNAYGIHHIYEQVPLLNILEECKKQGHPDRTYYFFSTSKITFPGSGISLIASGPENLRELKKHMAAQTIGHDKLNQLRHVRFFGKAERLLEHMDLLAKELQPKFDMVLDSLETLLDGSGLANWSHPKGGYFISLDTLPGCAKRTVTLAQEAGLLLTDAGATYPYGKDEQDRNIRIAPTYPTLKELEMAMQIFITCVQIAGLEKLIKEQENKK